MKKSLWLLLFVVLTCIVAFSACNSKESQPSNNDTDNNIEQSTQQPSNNNNSKEDNNETDTTPECQHIEVIDAAVAATCTTDGKTEGKHCSVCNDVLVAQTIIGKLGHTEIVDPAITATCTTDGKTEGKHCSVCNDVLVAQTIIGKLGHTEVVDPAVTATCTADGKTAGKHCRVCNAIIVPQLITGKLSHTESIWIIDAEATLQSVGSKHTECLNCGITIQTQVSPELEYSLSDVKQLLSKSIVKVYCYDYDGETLLSQGSGFFIDNTGTFITNAHVVENAYYIKIKTYLGIIHDVNIMYVYNYNDSDHAVCKAQNCFSTPVEFEEDVAIGDTVYAFGYPNDALILSATQGTVIATNVTDITKTYIENTAKIDHGSSGGILANSKGKVIGITTGILNNNNFAALSYSEFKLDATRIHFSTKEPLEWFHTKKEISLASHNIDKYFDIYVQGQATTATSVTYNVILRMNDKYASEKFILDGISLNISINLKTKYEWKEDVSYGTSNRSQSTTDYLSITFFSEDEIIRGKSTSAFSSIFLSSYKDYYDMSISYDVDFSSAFGTLIFYDASTFIY